jgi:hypothetical protein
VWPGEHGKVRLRKLNLLPESNRGKVVRRECGLAVVPLRSCIMVYIRVRHHRTDEDSDDGT